MKNCKKQADNKSLKKDYFIFNYVIVASIFSILLFLYGFFPIPHSDGLIASRKDIPKFVERTRIKLEEVYKPTVKKLIIMVIDALRWDFVTGKNNYMPITNSLLQGKAGCLYKTRVNPPTVTMPRIKATTTGSISNFVDVILNLGAPEIKGDSILKQIKYQGHNIVFYGDDTWIKLFPDIFYRYEGTTSFYVTDFTEVDNNVTRNVGNEITNKDWTVMILHYLGLDHIGHISGPFSSLVKSKLEEMDQIIGAIESYVLEWNKNEESTLFLICGDHGMKDSGGHGGSTLEETLVPLIVFGRACSDRKAPKEEIAQIDIAPTLSVLLGVPIPSSNLGSIVLNMMSELTLSQKLFALYYNAEQLFLRYQKVADYQHTAAYKNYVSAIKLHGAWLHTNSYPNEMVEDIIIMYESSILDMKKSLTNNLLEYDVYAMSLATIFLGHILYISMSSERLTSTSYRQFLTIFVMSYFLWMILNQLFDAESKTVLFSQRLDLHFVFVTVPILAILVLNCYLCATRILSTDKLKSWTNLQSLLAFGTFVHTLSLSSSSFVEEEHQIWYFFWITLTMYVAYQVFRKSVNVKQKSFGPFVMLLLLMISHRVLINLNSTGDKYAHLPDISGWLQSQDSQLGMTFVLILGLSLLVWLDFLYEEVESRSIVFFLDGILAILIYLRHAISNSVLIPSFYFDSQGVIEMSYFWAFTSIYCIHSFYRLSATKRHNKQKFLCLSLFLILKKCVIISCILHRPYNVILLPAQLIAGTIIFDLTRTKENFDLKLYFYFYLSNTFYFYQGNSNSLATIDVAAGYVGLETYQPLITGVFLTVNTYSAQILGFLMYLCDHALYNPLITSQSMLSLCMQYAFWRLIPMAFYTIITSFQRYHLFIWSVFSPKLLYEAMHCAVLFSLMFLLQFHFIYCDLVKA